MTEETVFSEALKIDDAQARAAYVQNACGGNASLIARVNELLGVYEQAGSFLQSPAVEDLTAAAPARDVIGEGPGSVIGPYRLLQQIGEGGMGSVYMAEQERPVRRRVALKIIKLGMDTKQVIARFEAERQALAIMDHPNIAKVLDAGSTASGRPYFVMELVRGSPITEYCDKHKLGVRARLELFAAVCRAVQHAHQKGIIHRDIKPSNILVTVADDGPAVKVIDFGIAKATNQRLTERTLFTEHRQLIGTPQYMSPEQADNDAADVDTRTDIYSLGVLLYELLTGTTPLDARSLRSMAYDRMQQAIRESESPRPSTRLSTMGEAIAGIAASRAIEPRDLAKALRGELDWIVMKCLEKDRSRRYETANGVARDIERHLADEAVEACPPSAAYRLKKFTRRYRRLLLTGGAFVVLLVASTVLSTVLAIRTNTAKNDLTKALGEMKAARTEAQNKAIDAEESEADTRAFATFLAEHVLAAGRPMRTAQGLGVNVTMIEALERAEPAIETVFKGRPRGEALAREQIGLTWKGLGRNEEAQRHLSRALELKHEILGAGHVSTLETTIAVLAVMPDSQADEAMQMAKQAVAAAENDPKIGPTHWATLLLRGHIGSLLAEAREFDKAIALLEEILPKVEAARGSADEASWIIRNTLASAYSQTNDRSKAPRVVELTAQNARQTYAVVGDDNVMTLASRINLASAHLFAREPKKAIEIMVVELPRARKLCGVDHEMTHEGVRCLVQAYSEDAQRDRAMACLSEHVERVTAKSGPGGMATRAAEQLQAEWTARWAGGEELVAAQTAVLRKYEKDYGEEDPRTAWQRNRLALALESAGRREEALGQYVLAMEAHESRGVASDDAVLIRNNYGLHLAGDKRLEDALRAHERTLELYADKLFTDSREIAETRGLLGGALVLLARPGEAVAPLERSLAVLTKVAPNDPNTLIKRSNLALAHAQLGDMDKAIEIVQALIDHAEKSLPAGHEHLPQYRDQLQSYQEHKRMGTRPALAPQK